MLRLKINKIRYVQYFSVTSAMLTLSSGATHFAWTSPTLPDLMSELSPLGVTLTKDEITWVVSILHIGGVVGCCFAAWSIQQVGRKGSFIIACFPLFLSWIVIIFADSSFILYIARFIAGLGVGICSSCGPVYNGEVSEKDIRGKISSYLVVLSLLGSLYTYTAGPFLHYVCLAITSAVFPLVAFLLCLNIPESPYFLVKKNDIGGARRSLIRLSANCATNEFIECRLKEIQETTEGDMQRKSTAWEFFSKRQYRKPIIIIAGFKTLQYFSGNHPIAAYMQTIIDSSGSRVPSKTSSIIFGVVQFLSALVSGYMIDKMGRKPLLLISSVSCAIALYAEGTYFYMKEVLEADVSAIAWLPTTALVIYKMMVTLGITTLPYTIMGELFPMNIKEIAASSSSIYGFSLGFLMNYLHQPVIDHWGSYTIFWSYGTACFLGGVFIFMLLPETKGKTFAEIQTILSNNEQFF